MASIWAFRFLLWYICIMLVQPQNRFTFMYGWHIADISIIGCMGCHLMSVGSEGKPLFRLGNASKVGIAFILLALVANYAGPLKTHYGWNNEIDHLMKSALVLILIDAMATTPQRVWAVQLTMVLCSLWWVKGGLRLSSSGATWAGSRIMGPAVSMVENPNAFAYMMCLFIPIYLYNNEHVTHKYMKAFFSFLVLSSIYIVLQTGSRTGLLILVALGAYLFPRFIMRNRTALLIMLAGTMFVFTMVSAGNIERFKRIGVSIESFFSGEVKRTGEMTEDEESAQDRRLKNEDTWRLILDNPVLGAGIHADYDLFTKWPKAAGSTHNELLMAGRMMGFGGMIVYLAFLLQMYLDGSYVQRRMKLTWPDISLLGWCLKSCAIIFFVGGMFSPGAFNPVMLMLCGAVSALRLNVDQNYSELLA